MQKESAIYYNQLEKLQGDSCLYKAVVYKDKQREELIFDHRTHDGISAMIKTLKANNLFYPGIFSGLKGRKKPGFLAILKAFIKFKLSMPYKPKDFIVHKKLVNEIAEAELCLSQVETKRILANAKAQKLNFNAYLVATVSEVLKLYSEASDKPFIFMLPINLRANINETDDFGNEVSFIDIKVNNSDSAKEIQAQMNHKFKSGLQWGAWFATKMIGYFPSFMHGFLIKDYVKSTPRTGLISTMGHWDRKEQFSHTKLNAIPVNFSHMPFSLSAVNWNNCLNLGLSLNPKLGLDEIDAKELLNHIKKQLIGDNTYAI